MYVFELASGQVRRLTEMAGNETGPHWSPDGERLVFSSVHDDGRYALHEIDAGGGEARPLADGSLSIAAVGWIGRLDPAFETGLPTSLFADDALVEAVRLAIGREPFEPLGNRISDVSPLLQLPLQRLILTGNPLSRESLDIHVPAMRAQGTLVSL